MSGRVLDVIEAAGLAVALVGMVLITLAAWSLSRELGLLTAGLGCLGAGGAGIWFGNGGFR
jgi:hypothetical protein